jgi:hypothetical protein
MLESLQVTLLILIWSATLLLPIGHWLCKTFLPGIYWRYRQWSQREAVWKIIDCRGATVHEIDSEWEAVVNEEIPLMTGEGRTQIHGHTWVASWRGSGSRNVLGDNRNEGPKPPLRRIQKSYPLTVGTSWSIITSIALCMLPSLTLFHSDPARTRFCHEKSNWKRTKSNTVANKSASL